jgi:hypothetical protein
MQKTGYGAIGNGESRFRAGILRGFLNKRNILTPNRPRIRKAHALQPEFLAKVKAAYIRIVDDFFRTALGQDLPGIDDIGAVGQS